METVDRAGPAAGGRAARDRALFDRAAARYARKDSLPASRRARRLRLEQTVSRLPLPDRAAIVEIGCGAGFAAEYLAGRYASYVGIDHSRALVDAARARHGGPGVRFLSGDALAAEIDAPVDLVLMIGVLHHLDEAERVLLRAVSWLRPGGFVAVNEPHPANPGLTLLRRLRKRLDDDYSDEQCELSATRLRDLFEGAGLVDVRIVPQGLFSTPFAEVVLHPRALADLASRAACATDRALEALAAPLLRPLTWNLVATGRTPGRDA